MCSCFGSGSVAGHSFRYVVSVLACHHPRHGTLHELLITVTHMLRGLEPVTRKPADADAGRRRHTEHGDREHQCWPSQVFDLGPIKGKGKGYKTRQSPNSKWSECWPRQIPVLQAWYDDSPCGVTTVTRLPDVRAMTLTLPFTLTCSSTRV